MRNPFEGLSPGSSQHRKVEGITVEIVGYGGRSHLGLSCNAEGYLNRPLDTVGLQALRRACLQEALMEAPDTFLELALGHHELPNIRCLLLGCDHLVGVFAGVFAQHRLLDLAGDHRPDTTEVFTHALHLLDGPKQELVITTNATWYGIWVSVRRADRVPDMHPVRALSMAVDAPVALLHHVWVPWNLEMD